MSKRETGLLEEPLPKPPGTATKKANERTVKHTNHNNEEHSTSKRKSTSSQQTKHYSARDTRTNRQGGGRDSAHSHKSDSRYKKDNTTDHNKHGGNKTNFTKDGSGWHKAHRSNNSDTSRGKGHKTAYSKANKAPLEGRDSGISVGDNVSPDSKHGGGEKEQLEEGGSKGEKESDVSINTDDANSNGKTEQTTEKIESSKIIYDRESLLKYRNSIKSLVTPVGFDQLSIEVAKDILKLNRRHSESDTKEDNPDSKHDEDTVKHSTTLPFNRDQNGDQKSNIKVSLMPQRRSFGSGCSWRDHQTTTTSNNKTPVSTAENNHKPEDTSSSGGWTTVQSSGSHPRVIDHVPYRSRPSHEWKVAGSNNKGSNWRGKTGGDHHETNDEEPEWMSFSPSDKYELMELKGIDEHELEREARRDEVKSIGEERSSLQDDSPSSSPLDKDMPKGGDLVDSGLPSSCPNDDEDGFVLDGFDFKNVLSICQELASDSDDDDHVSAGVVERDSLCKAKDSNELKNALISVLGITKDHPSANRVPPVSKPQPTTKRPLTLDEIEGQVPPQESIDQSAFNRFLASMDTSPSTEADNTQLTSNNASHQQSDTTGQSMITQQLKQKTFDSSPVLSHPPPSFPTSPFNHHPSHPPSIASSATIHSSDEWIITNTSPVWSTGGVSLPKPSSTPLLNPSPSSIGMQPPHIRQHKHGYGGTGGASAGTGNTWVTEMEQVRINELNQMKQQQQFREDRATASMKMQHQHLLQQKGSGRVPSLSFLPTSVMRQMHNSKPNPAVKDVRGSLYKRHDLEYSSDMTGSPHYMSRASESMYHGGGGFHRPQPPHPPSYHHYPYSPPYTSGYRRPPGMEMGQQGGYPGMVPSPHSQVPPSQYVGIGSSSAQPNPY